MHNLIDKFGLQEEGNRLYFKNYSVANINKSLINQATGKIDYCLDFISPYINTIDYAVAKKAATKRIAIIKDVIVANKRKEIDKDF